MIKYPWAIIAVAITVLMGSESVSQQDRQQRPPEVGKARVLDASGSVQKSVTGANKYSNLNIGDLLIEKTTVKTGSGAALLLQLPNRYLFRVGENSTVDLNRLGQSNEFSFNVVSGKVWNLVRGAMKPAKYEVQTPSAVVGVSGTIFSVFHENEDEGTVVSTSEGLVNVQKGEQSVQVARNQFTYFGRNSSVRSPMSIGTSQSLRQMWQSLRTHEFGKIGANARLNREFDGQFEKQWRLERPRRSVKEGREEGRPTKLPRIRRRMN